MQFGEPSQIARALAWIRFIIRDEHGAPLKYVRYELTCPDGTVLEGYTNGLGRMEAREIPGGTCQLRLPEFAFHEWSL
jgi:hypothetical protein